MLKSQRIQGNAVQSAFTLHLHPASKHTPTFTGPSWFNVPLASLQFAWFNISSHYFILFEYII